MVLSAELSSGSHSHWLWYVSAEAIHIGYGMLASDCIPTGCHFHWKLDTGISRTYSLNTADYLRLSLFQFTRRGSAGTAAFLNPVYWLVFDQLSTWSHENVDDVTA